MISRAERALFVGSYGPADEPGIHIFLFDEENAELRLHGAVAGVHNPSFLALHPGGRFLYAVSETGVSSDGTEGAVHALRIDRGSGSIDLRPLDVQPSGGDHPCHLAIAEDGRWLAVANYGTGSVAVLPIGDDGRLGPIASAAQHAGSGPNPQRQEGPHAHASVFTPDGGFVVVADLGIDRLVVYRFDADTGELARHGAVATNPGAGPRSLTFHQDQQHLFVANELDSTLTVLEWQAASGRLRPLQTVSTVPPGTARNAVGHLAVSRSGRHVYVSNRGHDSLAVSTFEATHRLGPIVVRPCGGEWPRGLAPAPDSRHIVVANRHSNTITVLPLLHDGGDIGKPQGQFVVSQPSCLVFA